MPHCIIEHSKNLEPAKLIDAVYQGARKSNLFEDDDIKSRTMGFDYYQSGSTKNSFVHVTTKILSGRNLEQRAMLSRSILSELESLNIQSTSLTVEVVEIERTSYAKVVT
ncbi:5-carboxymethyl-2-hydroxymuconate isomerase [Sinobacterium caligoides]|uniref:5-carboxymethyl-2-hydroxymuconate isomerase n=1 Tax=Sinobacterium caligoides TaxID=933926 RepID=A0A3N2DDY0_9GAMM|nr:5-carboxymethyl-2-hydroxymuconate Delta-isomerase [Sinobacterium caligoides]ROR98001.1 5-carboxymethyl-2-hydroxymuconate isomerase [Sinobacterium caligoides]